MTRPGPLILGTAGWGGGWNVGPRTAQQQELAEHSALQALTAALAAGIATLDTADLYAHGRAEQTLGRLLARDSGLRERVVLQSKAGILLGGSPLYPDATGAAPAATRYDNSPRHLRHAVEGSLERLQTTHLDVLLIHRPDPLTPVEQIVEGYGELRESGLVRSLGASNLGTAQARALDDALRRASGGAEGLSCVQMELSLHHRGLVEAQVLANTADTAERARVGEAAGLAQLCLERGITLQAWGSLAQGRFTRPLEQVEPEDRAVAELIVHLAAEHGLPAEAITLAWLLCLPWNVRPVIGSLNPERIAASARAAEAAQRLSSEQWYQLWTAARGVPLP